MQAYKEMIFLTWRIILVIWAIHKNVQKSKFYNGLASKIKYV